MRADARRTWIVIAAYNEGPAIGRVVAGLRSTWPCVVVVDDGSVDDTLAAARAAGARGVRHPVNLGQGAALQTGIEFALRQGAQFVVTFDADGQHVPDDIAALLAPLERGEADIACGSRFLGRAVDLPAARRIVLRLAARFTRWTTGLPLTDAHNGLRAMTAHCARTVRIRQNRMAHASEIVSEVARHRLRMVEVPTTVVYTEYSLRKGQRLSGALRILVDLLVSRLYR